MAQRLSIFHNKVARRILLSFVLAALMPISLLGLLSYQQVSEQLQTQTLKSLHKSSKNYALDLLGRLSLLESSLRLLSHQINSEGDGYPLSASQENKSQLAQFTNLIVISSSGQKSSLINNAAFDADLTEAQFNDVKNGHTLITPAKVLGPGINPLWMAINLKENQPQAGILLAALKPELLWDVESIEPMTLWVLGKGNQVLFASEPDFIIDPAVRGSFLQNNSGQFTLKHEGVDFAGAFWKVPIKSLFHGEAITIVQALPHAIAFSALHQFSTIYPSVILLAILIVALLSTRFISRYLTPLERLKTATVRIAEGDFNTQVNIDSRDEFETLADSFNEMTRRLRSQFDLMSTLAELDRLILSSLNANDIVEIALTRLPSVLQCDLISIAQIDPIQYQASNIRIRKTGKEITTYREEVQLNPSDILDLIAVQNGVIETGSTEKLLSYFKVLGVTGSWRYLIIPVVINNTLSSMICLGYRPPKLIPPESRSAARNFGDRIAVALSNAAWEEKLYRQAHYDGLTGLPNRLVLNDRLAQEMARATLNSTELAIIFIDLDRFKNINDSLGHGAGDELLAQVSTLLVNCVKETDLVVRLGGDEFVIVLTDLTTPLNPITAVRNTASRILTSLKQTLYVAEHAVTFSASLGIAVYPGDADNAIDLLKNADAAMYHAKNEGRDNFQFYSTALNASALENIKLEHELRGAISNGELRVFFQPKVDSNRRMVGAEALIRWQHRTLGMISPAKFIPLAEQTGLILAIGEWVFEQSCLWVKSCYDQNFKPLRISVNLSAIEFKQPDLVNKIAEILARTAVDPEFIELELTESVAIGTPENCIQRMLDLKSLGITLAMDDFGTGYSSLSYLKSLPLDVLKIDQSFVRKLETDQSSQAIIKAIFALANGLGMETVAEGVETEGQLAFLKTQQCEIFQGFLFSRPLPADEFKKMLVAEANNAEAQLTSAGE